VDTHVSPTPFCDSIRKINTLLMEPKLRFNPESISEFYLRSFKEFSKVIRYYDTVFLNNALDNYPPINKQNRFLKEYCGEKVTNMASEHIKILLINFNIYLNHARYLYNEVEVNGNRNRDYVVTLKYSTQVCLDMMSLVDGVLIEK
jgi:hypothetical protein